MNHLIKTTSGRMAGRLSPSQKEAIEKVLPQLDISHRGIINPVAIFGRNTPLMVEIGFGTGEFLYNMAKKDPHINFIGIELYLAGVVKLLRRMVDYDNTKKPSPENIRLIVKDSRRALKENFSDNSIDGLFILFPDPWPKKRHHKRRLINCDFAALVKKKLKKDGRVIIATDNEDYAEVIEESFLYNQFTRKPCSISEVYETKYARKALRKGSSIFAFEFVR